MYMWMYVQLNQVLFDSVCCKQNTFWMPLHCTKHLKQGHGKQYTHSNTIRCTVSMLNQALLLNAQAFF